MEGNKVSSYGTILGFPDVWRFARGPHPPPNSSFSVKLHFELHCDNKGLLPHVFTDSKICEEFVKRVEPCNNTRSGRSKRAIPDHVFKIFEETKKTHAAFRGKICSESIILEGKSQPGWKVPWCFSLNSWDPKSIAARLNHVDWICTQLEDIPRKTQLIFGEHLIIFAVLLFWEWVKKIWTLKMLKGLWCKYDDFNTLYT